MCEMCGCGSGKADLRLARANDVPVTLAAVPVRIVEPGAQGEPAVHQRRPRSEDPLSQLAPRAP